MDKKNRELSIKKYICLFIILLYTIIFSLFAHKTIAHIMDSDIASEMLLGQEQSDRGQWILSEDVYYNTEIRLFDIQFLVAPLLKIISSWNLATIIANAIYMFIFSTAIFFFVSSIGDKPRYGLALGAAIFVCLPYSYNFYYIGLGNGYYISKLMLEALILLCFLKAIKKKTKKEIVLPVLLLSFFSFIAGLKSIRYMLVLFFPLCMASFCVWWSSFSKKVKKTITIRDLTKCEDFIIICIVGLSTVINGIGYICNGKILAKRYHYSNYSILNFGDISAENNIFNRIATLIYGWLDVMGFSNNVGVFSLRGIVNVLIFAVIIFTVYAVVNVLKRYDELTKIEKVLFLFAIFSILFNTYVFGMTDVFVPRYYVPIYFVVIIIYYLFWSKKSLYFGEWSIKYGSIGLMIVYLLFSSYNTVIYANNLNVIADKQDLVSFLEENDFYFGYATYWNAAVLSGMTNGEIEMANIVDPSTMQGYFWNTCAKYYDENYSKKKTFIVLQQDENEIYHDCRVIQNGELVYSDGNYFVYSYDNSQTIYDLAK